ncbi:MAG: hypothetical protein K2G11_01610, partial [Muribaculaceae bacterium]|nr:hypothetical protein [Muribaculaceae bacterium]
MKRIFTLTLVAALCVPTLLAYDEFDDIYYNPSKEKTSNTKKRKSTYISNMADMDVDAYNRRGQYYVSDIDTIGYRTGTDEDFVYTQAIQKYYNPTIIVDNADLLADVLNNSYGNVQIELNSYGQPYFVPAYYNDWVPYNYGWSWGSPYFSIGWNWGPFSIGYSWGNPWYWGSSWNLGWG